MGKYKIYRGQRPTGKWKIGTTYRYPTRCKEQKLVNYHILEEHDCKKTAGIRERELQIQYGYEVDTHLYKGAIGRRKDYTVSDETRKKLSVSGKGRKVSKESIMKTIEKQMGSKHPNAKLTDEQVLEIRKKYVEAKQSFRTLSKEYNVGTHIIYRVVNNLSYRDVVSEYNTEHKRKVTKKLDENIVRYIRNQFKTGKYTKKRIANVFGISARNVLSIVEYHTWKNI